jgi:hypothetical protein
MSLIKLLVAPVRRVINFPLFQLITVVLLVVLLEAESDLPVVHQIFRGFEVLVLTSVDRFGSVFHVGSFTQSLLISGFWIAYVYLACLLILYLLRMLVGAVVDRVALSNAWLRDSIARDRGIEAYRAWEPLERIRPKGKNEVPQPIWEERYAWPAGNKPPYPPLLQRLLWEIVSYVAVILIFSAALQFLTPFPALSWLGRFARMLTGA